MSNSIYSNQWLDQVFEQHNKKYGAYVLRQKADDYTITGLLIAISIVGSIFIVPLINNLISGNNESIRLISEPHIFTIIDPPIFIPPVTETLKAVDPSPPAKLISDLIKPLIIKDNQVTDNEEHKELGNDDPNNMNVTLMGKGNINDTATGTGGGNGLKGLDNIDTTTYHAVEIMPEFPGGEDAMMKFLSGNLKFPPHLIDEKITGMVYISFIVNRDGNVTAIETLKGVGESKDFENEAKRVVAMMPKWKPGRQNGQNVSVYFTLPVRFSLR